MAAVWRERERGGVYFRCRCTDLRKRWHPHQGTAASAGERWIWRMLQRGSGQYRCGSGQSLKWCPNQVRCGPGLGPGKPNPVSHLFVIKAQVDQSINHTNTPNRPTGLENKQLGPMATALEPLFLFLSLSLSLFLVEKGNPVTYTFCSHQKKI